VRVGKSFSSSPSIDGAVSVHVSAATLEVISNQNPERPGRLKDEKGTQKGCKHAAG